VADNKGADNRNAARTPNHLTLIFPKDFLPARELYEPDRTSDAKDQAALVGSPWAHRSNQDESWVEATISSRRATRPIVTG
jgi:hypothetical protein